MNHHVSGGLSSDGLKFAIVSTRWNDLIVDRLVDGAVGALRRCGASPADIYLARVPGAYETPLAARKLAATGAYNAIIVLGCVIRGATPHFDYVAGAAANGVAAASAETGVPMSFGVLTVDTMEQALERAGAKAGNKGEEAALAAIEMSNLLRTIEHAHKGD
ncbi:MAG: 6,7-dimethyl-8-ribityllumazine synthase [Alphaproteobacteria bacterium]|nr:6,7-dimethyl-8-ribityllumazine synthase [Alphaproteobacteria bacterium]